MPRIETAYGDAEQSWVFTDREMDSTVKALTSLLDRLNGSYIAQLATELEKMSPDTPYKIGFDLELERVVKELNRLTCAAQQFITRYSHKQSYFMGIHNISIHGHPSRYFEVDNFLALLAKLPQLLNERIDALRPYTTRLSFSLKQHPSIITQEEKAIYKMLHEGLSALHLISFVLMVPFWWVRREGNIKFVQNVLASMSLTSDAKTASNVIIGLVVLLGVGLLLGSSYLNCILAATSVNDTYEKLGKLKKQCDESIDQRVVEKIRPTTAYTYLKFFSKSDTSPSEIEPIVSIPNAIC